MSGREPPRTPVAGADEDPNVDVHGYASPPCLMHELEPAWSGLLADHEVTALLFDLLTDERRAARVLWLLLHGPLDAGFDAAAARRLAADARRGVRTLCATIAGRGETPAAERRPLAAVDPGDAGWRARLRLLLAVRRGEVARLQASVSRVGEPAVARTLRSLLASRDEEVDTVRRLLGAGTETNGH